MSRKRKAHDDVGPEAKRVKLVQIKNDESVYAIPAGSNFATRALARQYMSGVGCDVRVLLGGEPFNENADSFVPCHSSVLAEDTHYFAAALAPHWNPPTKTHDGIRYVDAPGMFPPFAVLHVMSVGFYGLEQRRPYVLVPSTDATKEEDVVKPVDVVWLYRTASFFGFQDMVEEFSNQIRKYLIPSDELLDENQLVQRSIDLAEAWSLLNEDPSATTSSIRDGFTYHLVFTLREVIAGQGQTVLPAAHSRLAKIGASLDASFVFHLVRTWYPPQGIIAEATHYPRAIRDFFRNVEANVDWILWSLLTHVRFRDIDYRLRAALVPEAVGVSAAEANTWRNEINLTREQLAATSAPLREKHRLDV